MYANFKNKIIIIQKEITNLNEFKNHKLSVHTQHLLNVYIKLFNFHNEGS